MNKSARRKIPPHCNVVQHITCFIQFSPPTGPITIMGPPFEPFGRLWLQHVCSNFTGPPPLECTSPGVFHLQFCRQRHAQSQCWDHRLNRLNELDLLILPKIHFHNAATIGMIITGCFAIFSPTARPITMMRPPLEPYWWDVSNGAPLNRFYNTATVVTLVTVCFGHKCCVQTSFWHTFLLSLFLFLASSPTLHQNTTQNAHGSRSR